MTQSDIREDLQALKDELHGESKVLRDEIRETRLTLANHMQEDARSFVQLQSEREAKKSVLDRCLSVALLIVSVGKLVTLFWKDFK
jgi:hypothetical protein